MASPNPSPDSRPLPPVLAAADPSVDNPPGMHAVPALRAAWHALRRQPVRAAKATLLPIAPPLLLSLAASLPLPALLSGACSIAAFAFLGPALVAAYRGCLLLLDGADSHPAIRTSALKAFLPLLCLNFLRLAAAVVILVPALFALVFYLFASGSPVAHGAPPSTADVVVFMVVSTPAAFAVICVKCLTYLFEILIADGAETRFWPCLASSVRIAWRNIRPIAWIFTYLGLAAIPLLGAALAAAPLLEGFVATPAATPGLGRLAATEQAAKILFLPILPWMLLTLAEGYRQLRPSAHPRPDGSTPLGHPPSAP